MAGGQIDDVFDQLRGHLPGLIVQRLKVTYRADDDNVYFIGDQHQFDLIHVDTRPDGQPPFLIGNGGRHEATGTTEAVSIIQAWFNRISRLSGHESLGLAEEDVRRECGKHEVQHSNPISKAP